MKTNKKISIKKQKRNRYSFMSHRKKAKHPTGSVPLFLLLTGRSSLLALTWCTQRCLALALVLAPSLSGRVLPSLGPCLALCLALWQHRHLLSFRDPGHGEKGVPSAFLWMSQKLRKGLIQLWSYMQCQVCTFFSLFQVYIYADYLSIYLCMYRTIVLSLKQCFHEHISKLM